MPMTVKMNKGIFSKWSEDSRKGELSCPRTHQSAYPACRLKQP